MELIFTLKAMQTIQIKLLYIESSQPPLVFQMLWIDKTTRKY